MAETMRSGLFIEVSRQFENLLDLFPPNIGEGIDPVGLSCLKQTHTASRCALMKAIPKPIGNVGEDIPAVLFRAEKHLVALQPVHVEQTHVGDSEAGIDHHP